MIIFCKPSLKNSSPRSKGELISKTDNILAGGARILLSVSEQQAEISAIDGFDRR